MKNYKIYLLLLLLNTALFAQDGGSLDFLCKVINDQRAPMKDVQVELMKDDEILTTIKTKKNGQFNFSIFFDGYYKITFSRPGYISMQMDIDGLSAKGDLYIEFNDEVTLFAEGTPGVDPEKFKKPFLKLIFDGKEEFIPDEKYDAEFNASKTTLEVENPEVKKNTTHFSKDNYPEQFAFADTDKNNVISTEEMNSAINELKNDGTPERSKLVEALIDWMLE